MAIRPEQMIAYLDDHLPYERMMLEYTLGKMSTHQTTCDWNAYYESFAVHARNLYRFLGNEEDVRACDFVPHFSAEKSKETKATFPDLLSQVLHLRQARPTAAEQKVQLEDAHKFYAWVDTHFSAFISKLPPEHKKHWNIARSIPPKPGEGVPMPRGFTGPTQQTEGQTIQVNSTTPSATNNIWTSKD